MTIVLISWTAHPQGSTTYTWRNPVPGHKPGRFEHLPACEPRITILFSSCSRVFPGFGNISFHSLKAHKLQIHHLFGNELLASCLSLTFGDWKALYHHSPKRIYPVWFQHGFLAASIERGVKTQQQCDLPWIIIVLHVLIHFSFLVVVITAEGQRWLRMRPFST